MCGQIAYDWNTIPSPRSLAGTRVPRSDEKSTRSATEISPRSGISSPATQRSVVVLPHPDGPRSVNSSPSSTSKLRSSTACTRPCFSLRDEPNVLTRFRIVSISRLPDADLGAELVGDRDHHDQSSDHQHPERAQLRELAVAPHLPDRDREHLAPGRVQQDGAAELAHRDDDDVDPPGDEAGHEQRQDDPPEGLEPAGPAHQRGLLELAADLEHRRRRVPHTVRYVPRHVRDEQDPERAVDRQPRRPEVDRQDRDAENEARDDERQEREVVDRSA